ncbi:MAG: chorismate mutase [Micavibrio sp.]
MPRQPSGAARTAAAKPYNSPELDAIRQKIDELDNRIHDTLMERAELVLKVGEEKRRNNIQIVQPAREARMIRRLLARHTGVLPEMAVVRIWRELVGAVSLLQTGLKVVVVQPEGQNNETWDMARDYFGSCLPMARAPSAMSAIAALKDGMASFAVVPRPDIEEDQPWWMYLDPAAPEPVNIIMSLPHGDDPEDKNPEGRALVLSRSGFDDSGHDNSFLLIQCDAAVSRGRLVDLAKKAGVKALHISSRRGGGDGAPAFHLMEVEDYITRDDKRVAAFTASLDDPGANIVCAGGYPVPPSYSHVVRAAAPQSISLEARAPKGEKS